MKFKKSKYNVHNQIDGKYYVTNLFSGNSICCNLKNYHILLNILKSPELYESNPSLEYLLKQGFIVNIEDGQLENLIKRHNEFVLGNDILHLSIMQTYDCNLRCVYCFQTRDESTVMSDDTQDQIITFLEKNLIKFKKLYINWFGGEPLLHKDKLLELNKRIKDICKKEKVSYVGRVTTNGYELDYQTFSNLVKDNVLLYYISLDGPKELHDLQRPHVSGESSFDKIMNNLIEIKNNAKSRLFRIEIRVNISKYNFHRIDEFLNLFQEEFSEDNRFVLVLDKVQDWGEKVAIIKDQILENQSVIYWANQAKLRGINLGQFMFNVIDTQLCQAPKKNGYIITYDGKVRKCQMAMESGEHRDIDLIGLIDKNGDLSIDLKKEKMWIIDKLGKRCKKCVALPICLGSKCIFSSGVKGEKCENVVSKIRETMLITNVYENAKEFILE